MAAEHEAHEARHGAAWLALLAFAAMLAASVRTVSPPPPASADAPEDVFNAERAFAHVKVIAAEPHPLGSPRHDEVLAYIVEQIRAGGIEPAVQEGKVGEADLKNVIARIPGRGRAGAILLAAHYDSAHPSLLVDPGEAPVHERLRAVDSRDWRAEDGSLQLVFPGGVAGFALPLLGKAAAPGAGDDGAAVAALLEVARILAAGPPLERDVIVLLSDGEELGLLGAQLFEREHPWAADVAAAFNFEARGNAGPSILFQVGPRSHGLVSAFAEASPHPFGTSCGPAVYERMPNDTDFTIFAGAGWPGLNFALCAGGSAYHRPWDTPENLVLGSLQHHGEHALALARSLGNAEELPLDSGPRTFFNAVGIGFVHYPGVGDLIVAVAAIATLLAALAAHRHSGSLRLRAFGISLALVPLVTLGLAAAIGLFWLGCSAPAAMIVHALRGAGEQHGNWGSTLLTSSGAALASVGIGSTVLAWTLRRGARVVELTCAVCVWWIAGGTWLLFVAPGAAYLALWPALLGALATFGAPRIGTRSSRWWWMALASLLSLALLLPTLHLFAFVGSTSARGTAVLTAAFGALMATAVPLGLAPLAKPAIPWPRRAAVLASIAFFAAAGMLDAAGR
jgi:hypothetical protein